jgi:hypothetical protein
MRPAHLLHHYLRHEHLSGNPVLALLGPADALLDALLLALRARHPRLQRHPLPDEPWDRPVRRAQTVAALAVALQGALAEYQDDEIDQVELERRQQGLA